MHLYYPNGSFYCKEEESKKEYFYPDGTLKTVERYASNLLDGESLLYWPSGKLKRKCHFKKGIRHGTDQMWNEEGVLVDEGCYEMGKSVGTHCRFCKKGTLIEKIQYLEGGRFNFWQWEETGHLRTEATWSDCKYQEKTWDRFQDKWIEKKGFWNGKRLIYT